MALIKGNAKACKRKAQKIGNKKIAVGIFIQAYYGFQKGTLPKTFQPDLNSCIKTIIILTTDNDRD